MAEYPESSRTIPEDGTSQASLGQELRDTISPEAAFETGPQLPPPPRASVPPSEPRPSRGSLAAIDAQADRPARLQMIVALILGLVLVAIPLYLWRRPRAESLATAKRGEAAGPQASESGSSVPATATPEAKLVVGEVRVVSCHDAGPKKTAPEQCDHIEMEKAFSKAVEETASCVPSDAGGGTIAYQADVSFKRKVVSVTTPKDARTFKSAKVVAACQAAVKAKLQAVPLDRMPHQHQRYRLGVSATYPGPTK